MTPEGQAARSLFMRLTSIPGQQYTAEFVVALSDGLKEMLAAIEQAVIAERSEGQIRLANAVARVDKKARQEEREACAMVAENFYGEAPHYITVEMGHAEADIAAAIRARAGGEEQRP